MKDVILVFVGYLCFCSLIGLFESAMMIAENRTEKSCGKFYAYEVIFPATPMACLLSKQIYP